MLLQPQHQTDCTYLFTMIMDTFIPTFINTQLYASGQIYLVMTLLCLLCLLWQNTSSPRDATQMILQRLQSEFGLHLKSSFEMEFGIKDSRSQTYLGDGSQWGSLTTLRKHQVYYFLCYGLYSALENGNVNEL